MTTLRILGIGVLAVLPTFGCGEDKPFSPSSPAPSNDQIVFVSARDGNNEIYTVHIDGTGLTRLTHDAAVDECPAWSPDGRHITFASNRTGAFEIYVMNADGSDVMQRTFTASYSVHPSWSSQGDTIAYSTVSDGSANLWKVGAFSGDPSLLFSLPGWDDQPAWSPDGARVAFASDWHMYDFTTDVFLVNSDGAGFDALTGTRSDSLDCAQPSWSPDGSRLSLAITRTVDTAAIPELAVMNQDGSHLTPLGLAAVQTRSSWSPDGQRIVYTSLTKDVVWIKADGSASGTVITNGWNADWRP